MEKRSVGFIETIGLASAVEAADAVVKSGNVTLLGYEYSGYDSLVHNALTVGDDLQIASGKRPQGTNKTGKCVGKWNPVGAYIYE